MTKEHNIISSTIEKIKPDEREYYDNEIWRALNIEYHPDGYGYRITSLGIKVL